MSGAICLKTWEYVATDGRPITVRNAHRGDASYLHNGFKEVVDEGRWLPTFSVNANITDWLHWIDKTNHARDVLLVAFLAEQFAGYLTLQPEEWNASQHVAKLGVIVRKHCRSVGVGCSLMKASEEIGLEKNYLKIVLSTFEDNTTAINLYKRLGYRIVGVRKNHFSMPKGFIDELLMEKELLQQ